MPHSSPLVSVITVNYNQSIATCDMLKSLYACGYDNLEVIVVDNASPKDHPDLITEMYPQVKLIKNSLNTGFAGGNNIGICQSSGKYLFLLNNDTIVPAECITLLVEKLESHRDIGIVCPKIKFFDRPDTIQYAGYEKMSTIGVHCKVTGYGEKDNGQYDHTVFTNYAHGAAMMLKREIIEKVGLMPDIYFLYYEELDWCERIKKAGYRILYVHDVVIMHKESLATGHGSPLKTYYMNRNRFLYARRNMSGILLWINVIYLLLIAYPKNVIIFLFKRNYQNAQSVLNAWWWSLRHAFDQSIHVTPRLNRC